MRTMRLACAYKAVRTSSFGLPADNMRWKKSLMTWLKRLATPTPQARG